ncbi:hypothetical protein AMAG_07228 [Allomyces macrogynus ATCC 38327]|uniref:Uncharacterized protein n=1 Tax=Allomyces macrogynus (strain ATCC 38327) TaxID=578462 RepID=A0A0L0SHP4_ALLM3|nr:hypothetical protein AMAG_07228 [Allomyces macrogynus ATCC 38327]|eukprot:KNE61962.1 hypothetical protein AMAG_07228 [Allomyces macrogynus ATCC 38327]
MHRFKIESGEWIDVSKIALNALGDGRPDTQRVFTAALTELVDQDKIKRTKVGRVWWYSCLPDQTLQTKRAELAKLKAEVGQLKAQYEALARKLGMEQALNEGWDLDEVLNERIKAVDASLTEKLTKYGDLGNREELETTLQHIKTCREANRRNVQNLRILQLLYRDELGVTPESLERQTGIPVNLEDMK